MYSITLNGVNKNMRQQYLEEYTQSGEKINIFYVLKI